MCVVLPNKYLNSTTIALTLNSLIRRKMYVKRILCAALIFMVIHQVVPDDKGNSNIHEYDVMINEYLQRYLLILFK